MIDNRLSIDDIRELYQSNAKYFHELFKENDRVLNFNEKEIYSELVFVLQRIKLESNKVDYEKVDAEEKDLFNQSN